jgi:hypothetical protein
VISFSVFVCHYANFYYLDCNHGHGFVLFDLIYKKINKCKFVSKVTFCLFVRIGFITPVCFLVLFSVWLVGWVSGWLVGWVDGWVFLSCLWCSYSGTNNKQTINKKEMPDQETQVE